MCSNDAQALLKEEMQQQAAEPHLPAPRLSDAVRLLVWRSVYRCTCIAHPSGKKPQQVPVREMADPHRFMLIIEVLMPCFYGLILLLSFVVANKYKPVHLLLWLFL